MKNHFDPKSILRDRGCSLHDTAMQIHDRYVSYNSDSMENAANPNFFKIINAFFRDENYYIFLLENNLHGLANRLESIAYSKEELIDVLCGGKINCHGKRFNTKEAKFEKRVEVAIDFLTALDRPTISEDEIRQKIATGILTDNASALLATHWLTQLDNFVGFSQDDVMHVLWCIFINWDKDAEVLKAPFPLQDAHLIEKDTAVLQACKEALGISLDDTKKHLTQTVTPTQINALLHEINRMFVKLCGQAPLDDEKLVCLTHYLSLRAEGDIASIHSGGFLQRLMDINIHMNHFVKTQAAKPAVYSEMSLFAPSASLAACIADPNSCKP